MEFAIGVTRSAPSRRMSSRYAGSAVISAVSLLNRLETGRDHFADLLLQIAVAHAR